MSNKLFILFFMVTIVVFFLGYTIRQKNNQIAFLKEKVVNLEDRNYHDSTMLSEYQLGLEEFMDKDPIAAERFMQCVERAFE